MLSREKLDAIRQQFPILNKSIDGKPLVYLDNAATTQRPQAVIDAVTHFYQAQNANVHRGVYHLSEQATIAYESVRDKVAQFINAATNECVFTRGTTESINLVAQSYARNTLQPGDEVLISEMEHHSNIVPWQIVCQQTGATLKVIPINDRGEIILEQYTALLSDKTKIVAIGHISNALGTINPIKQMIEQAQQFDAITVIDGAQATPHMKVDVKALNCDFYAFSAHKMYGPTGIGVLYGKYDLLAKMPPYQSGGDMITQVSFEETKYQTPPLRFEAGTPNIAGTIGLGAAIDFLNGLDFEMIHAHEQALLEYATEKLKELKEIRIIGEAESKTSVISFYLDEIHPHDVGTVLDQQGVSVRAGHHCAMPVMERFKVPATVRASFAFYNTQEEIDQLITALLQVKELFHE